MFKHKNIFIGLLVSCSAFCASNAFAAENATDDVTITVPVACSMTSTVGSAHTATVDLGTYEDDIGETTFNVLCNDSNGFAVYAVGFSDDTLGNTVMKPSTLSAANAIATGTATSGNTSNWAMKLTAVSGTYAPTLATGFNAYHTVPDEYTKVASLASNTDATVGSSFKSTYAVYISQAQPADSYTGKVKYTVIHPASVTSEALSNAVTLNFDGNGLSFEDGSETNTIQYAEVCDEAEQAYVSTAHEDIASSNFDSNGNQNGSYTNSEYILQTVTRSGADKLKVVVDYNITGDTTELIAVEGTWDGNWGNLPEEHKEINSSNNISGTKTYIIEGDTVTLLIDSWDEPEAGHNYGFYVKVYSVYETQQANTELEDLPCNCYIQSISGSYEETTTWKGRWDLYINNSFVDSFYNESDLLNYINNNYDELMGSSLTVVAYNPVLLAYNGNGASDEYGGMGYHSLYDRDWGNRAVSIESGNTIVLVAPNYKRTGYGFVGWSPSNNAASNLPTATIYGPDEIITVDDTFLNYVGDDGNITLYATWVPSAGNLQSWDGCSSMNTGSVTALTDTRDNNTYAVAKLIDGNCWMIENLRLGGSSDITLSASNTQSAGTLPAAYTGTENWSNFGTANKKISVMNTSSSNNKVTSVRQKNYAYGNYYSWLAAINTDTDPANFDDVNTSICPSGWELPSTTNFDDLIEILGNTSNAFSAYPYNFVNAGIARGANDYHRTYQYAPNNPFGIYTTKTSNSTNTFANCFVIKNHQNGDVSIVNTSQPTNSIYDDAFKAYGHSVRCLTN